GGRWDGWGGRRRGKGWMGGRVTWGVGRATGSTRRRPGRSEGIWWVPAVSQVAVRVTVMAWGPARSESSQRRTLPLAMSAPPMLQPGGSAAMQGSMAADGTAWALRIIEWPVPQTGG